MTVTGKDKLDKVLNAFKLFKGKARTEVLKRQKEQEEARRREKAEGR